MIMATKASSSQRLYGSYPMNSKNKIHGLEKMDFMREVYYRVYVGL